MPSSASDGEAKTIVFILAGKSGVVSSNVEKNIKDSGLEKFSIAFETMLPHVLADTF